MMSTTPNDTYIWAPSVTGIACAHEDFQAMMLKPMRKSLKPMPLSIEDRKDEKQKVLLLALEDQKADAFPSRSSCVAAKAAAKATGKKSARSNSSSSSSASSSSSSKSATRWALRAERSELLLAISARHRRGQ